MFFSWFIFIYHQQDQVLFRQPPLTLWHLFTNINNNNRTKPFSCNSSNNSSSNNNSNSCNNNSNSNRLENSSNYLIALNDTRWFNFFHNSFLQQQQLEEQLRQQKVFWIRFHCQQKVPNLSPEQKIWIPRI